MKLCPGRKNDDGSPAEPQSHEFAMLVADPEAAAELRRRLSSISWTIRFLSEKIARQANREDRCTGRFWEGRYKCQRLLDEALLLACSIYVDLNPIRAGLAETPETSEFTAAYERIRGMQAQRRQSSEPAEERAEFNSWLSSVFLDQQAPAEPVAAGSRRAPEHRASHLGFLSLKLREYLGLLDWTGRQLGTGKRGAIPAEYASIVERLGLAPSAWLDAVVDFGRRFRRAAGSPAKLAEEASRRDRRWLAGIRHSRAVFG